ncbi:DsbA family protein [Chitinophaga nivalis]|uniref:DsbA family protein n=1 Tax=Chitinophaga nivalis TaxID=2991709 RepID=A0ABT3IHT0_9BACT|nr:DsbA family protein [Chitinophaga nivalis]MCW3466791.1 DsbA family protein [Chitinophaga nivalis]MCW3483518.1 DsbA family protein [Chitinophaga nivalis]
MQTPLFCDPATGVCEIPGAPIQATTVTADMQSVDKPVKLIYFTDPICSTCWGIEPQWRKLKLEYGHLLDINYHMGGLLPSWDVYQSGGISGPADVAHHWDEVSQHYQMPIDGNVWLEDPLPSSYPPSIWFKAAQRQDQHKAIIFLRRMREMLFMDKQNITRPEPVLAAAAYAGLDTTQLQQDFEQYAPSLFEADLQLGKQMGVRGFPSVFFISGAGESTLVYGAKPYAVFTTALLKMIPDAQARTYARDLGVFSYYPTLTTKEFAVLNDLTYEAAETQLNAFHAAGQLGLKTIASGHLWWLL